MRTYLKTPLAAVMLWITPFVVTPPARASVQNFETNGAITALAEDANAWYVGGAFTMVNLTLAYRLIRLDLDGRVSAGCRFSTRVGSDVKAVATTADAIFIGGTFTTYNGQPANRLAKITKATCELDPTFNPPAANGFNGDVYALTMSNGALYVGGAFTQYRGVADSANDLAKLDPITGALDTTFSPAGATSNGFNAAVTALVADGTSLFVGGQFTQYKGVTDSARRIAKLDLATGAIDTTFSPAGALTNGFDNYVMALALGGGALYAGGSFTAYKGTSASARYVAKLDPASGALDTTFSPPGSGNNGFDSYVYSLAFDAGMLYVGGAFTAYRSVTNSANRLAKLDGASGAIDTTFSPAGATSNGFNAAVYALALNGTSLYVGGAFTAYQGVANSASRVAKLDVASGALDTSFLSQPMAVPGFNFPVRALLVDGTRLWAGGEFLTYGGRTVNRFAKFAKATGELDTTVSPLNGAPTGFDGQVFNIEVSGNALVVSGSFRSYRDQPVPNVVFIDRTTGALRP